MKRRVKVKVCDIKKGDEFVSVGAGWLAVADAEFMALGACVRVQYKPDGGMGVREWDDANHEIKVTRRVK